MYFSKETVQKLNRRRKFHKACDAAAGVVALCACILLCIFADHDNKTLMIALSCIIAVGCGWFVIADFYLVILPYKYAARHIEVVNGYERVTVSGEVLGIKKVTVTKWITAYEVLVSDGKCSLRLYWHEDAGELPFKEDDNISAVTADGYIISCEVRDGQV